MAGVILALPEGLEITEVMRLASYSKYDTTLKYYPAVKDDLVDRGCRAQGQWSNVGGGSLNYAGRLLRMLEKRLSPDVSG